MANDMKTIRIDLQDETSLPITLKCGQSYTFVVAHTMRSLSILELEDALFHSDSAVFLPQATDEEPGGNENQKRINGLDVLLATFRHLQESKQALVVAGHADTTGSNEYNKKLSKMRAESVVHLLEGQDQNRIAWQNRFGSKTENGCNTKTERDIQVILKWAATDPAIGWSCNPGPVDGIVGSKTTAAIKQFQIAYNTDFNKNISEDGISGKQTWGAVFDLYQREISNRLVTDNTSVENYRKNLRWKIDEKVVGCGEQFPIDAVEKDNYKSKSNRRVEILFFDQNDKFTLNCTKDNTCLEDGCPIYGSTAKRKRTYISPSPSTTTLTVRLQEQEAGVTVSITGPETRKGTTDNTGTVIFCNLPKGKYKVTATKGVA